MLRGVDAPLEIVRDRFGVPHVSARTPHDLCFALGFCHGQDRLWQLEFFRRATAGRLSEFAGPEALPADRLMRTIGMRRVAEREAREIDSTVAPLRARTSPESTPRSTWRPRCPIEFQLARLEPEPWTVVDLLASAKLMGFGLSTNWEMELLRADLVRAAGPERAARLEPQYPRANPVVTSPGGVYAGDGVDIAAQIAAVKESLGLGDARDRFEQLGRVGDAP